MALASLRRMRGGDPDPEVELTPWLPHPPYEQGEHWFRRFRRIVFRIANGDTRSRAGQLVLTIVLSAILTSLITTAIGTLASFRRHSRTADNFALEGSLDTVETVVASVFIAEFSIRLLTITATRKEDVETKTPQHTHKMRHHPRLPRKPAAAKPHAGGPCHAFTQATWKLTRFVLSPTSLIDIASFAPWVVDHFLPSQLANTSVIRVLRVVRVFQLFKFSARSHGFQVLLNTVRNSARALALLGGYYAVAIAFAGALVFYAEQGEYSADTDLWMVYDGRTQRMVPSSFSSMPLAMYFVLASLTTAGYGDFVAITPAGRFLASVIVLAGVMAVALPVSILVARFPVEYEAFERASQIEAEAFRRKLTATLRATTIMNLTRRGSKVLFMVPWAATNGSRSAAAKDDSSKRAMPPEFRAPAPRVVYDTNPDDANGAAGTLLTPKWQRGDALADGATGLQRGDDDDDAADGHCDSQPPQQGDKNVLHPFHMQFLMADSRAMQADVAAMAARLDGLLQTLDPSLPPDSPLPATLISGEASPLTPQPPQPTIASEVSAHACPVPPLLPAMPDAPDDDALHPSPVEASTALEDVYIEVISRFSAPPPVVNAAAAADVHGHDWSS